MSNSAKNLVDLAPEDAAFVERRLRAGGYASASEVIGAGLRALREQEAAVEFWLRDEVGPVFDAMRADPTRGIPAREVLDRLRTHHAARLKAGE